MKNILTLILAFIMPLLSYADEAKYNTVTTADLPKLSVGCNQGVSGAFAGMAGGQLVVAGGCNFPETPAAEGGSKRFYSDIYSIQKDKWVSVGKLSSTVAYGASVTVNDGVICIGGTDGTKSSKEVLLISLDGAKAGISSLPSLPIGLDNFSAAYDKVSGYIYVAGGQTDGQPSLKVWRMSYPNGKAWESLPDLPGKGRVQPCVVVQNGNVGANLYVFGGFTPAVDKEHPETSEVQAGGLCLNLKTNEWKETSPILDGKAGLVGAVAVASGSQHIIFFGGVDKDIFTKALRAPEEGYLTHEPAWYKFRQAILVFNTITGAWSTSTSDERFARAGSQIVTDGNQFYLVGGETKPGIRSTDVTSVTIDKKADFGWLNWLVLVLYLLGMIALGYYFMKRESGAEDFFKGGGRIPWWAAGISIYATMLSAITYMAYPAKAFATDWTYYPMLVTILIVSFPVIHYYLPFFRRLNVTTAYEYLERRFNAVTRLMASALFIIFMVARMALVLYLPSLALTAVTGIDIYICIVLMAAITILYCTMGGVEAVVWGDVVQGFILVGGAVFAVVYLILGTDGGFSGFLDITSADDKFRLFDWSLSYDSATFWVIIVGGMANNLISYTSDQTVIQRYLTTKDEGEARRSIMMNGIMSVFVSVAFFAIGAGLYTFFKTHPADMDITMAKNDIIFPFFMMSQLPAGLAGLLIAAIFAATMSTISSNINSVATAFSVDFYKRFRPSASDKSILSCARYTCIISGVIGMVIALLMATWNILSLLDFFQEILGLLSSGLGGLFLMGIFFPRIGGKAALAGFVSGVVAVFVTKYYTEASFLLYGAIGMCVSVVIGYILSFILNEKKAADGLTWSTLEKEK